MRLLSVFGFILAICSSPGLGDVKLPALISDRVVFQRDLPIHVWGWAVPGEAVTVALAGQKVETRAAASGRWEAWLPALPAGGPHNLVVAGTNQLTLNDVLIGEVWVASGQSNMQWPVKQSAGAEKEIAAARYPGIRMFTVERRVAEAVQDDVTGSWQAAAPESVGDFSAVAFFFGRTIHQHLSVPIGIIHSSWGGTPAESWISKPALMGHSELHPILWNWKRILLDFPYANARYEDELHAWESAASKAKAEGVTEPPRPRAPQGPGHSWTPSGLYNAMIAPLTSFSIRGAIWYQGESNAQPYRSLEYRRLFPALIEDWRRAWGQGPFPFLFVQLANFRERKAEPSESTWAELQEAQRMTLALPGTGMAVIIDLGEADDIHPQNKQDVGARLALAARTVAYGEQLVYSGPLYQGAILEGDRVRILFDHVGSGLKARGTRLEGFAIAGRDRKFVWADARIEGRSVVVSSPEVPNPVAVRYAWQDNPVASLYNEEGLPASPFRTDDWSVADADH